MSPIPLANATASREATAAEVAAIDASAPRIATRGMGGRLLTLTEKAHFDAFAQRAMDLGWLENPNRTGSWGRIVNGRFQELARIDVAEAGAAGWRGRTHIHVTGQQGHLPLNTPLPGEPGW
jgi:hypothetical protein